MKWTPVELDQPLAYSEKITFTAPPTHTIGSTSPLRGGLGASRSVDNIIHSGHGCLFGYGDSATGDSFPRARLFRLIHLQHLVWRVHD